MDNSEFYDDMRWLRRRWRKVVRILLRILLFILLLCIYLEIRRLQRMFSRVSAPANLPRILRAEKLPSLYVASINSRSPLADPRAWIRGVERIAASVGGDRVYVSIYEKIVERDHLDALDQLKRNLRLLGVQYSFVTAPEMNPNQYDPTWTAQGLPVPPNATSYVSHLANLRNMALRPMIELAMQDIRFDRILFLEDIAFTGNDVLQLLSTRNGSFGAACAMGLDSQGGLCDTFALRDSKGHGPIMPSFPYFRSKASRRAVLAEEAIPVQSCWGGMVAFDAKPFYHSLQPVLFRGIPDSLAENNLEASEGCLIYADNPYNATEDHLKVWNPNVGIWMNPHVRVGCTDIANPDTRWPSEHTKIVGIWKSRLWRWSTSTLYNDWTIKRRLRSWERKHPGLREPGLTCLVNHV